jgi:uncharacterized membrane protein (UPF0136 family)
MNPPTTPWAVAAIAAVVYGLISLAGGVLGFVNKGSRPSLIAGGSSGLALILFGTAMWLAHPWGAIGAIVLTFLLVGRFASSLAKQRRLAGGVLNSVLGKVGVVMVGGGVVVFVLAGWALLKG